MTVLMHPPPATSAAERAARQREVENAILVQALCGRSPAPAVHEQLRRYIEGELSREQAFSALYAKGEKQKVITKK